MNIKQEAELFYKAVTRVSNRVDKADDLTAIIARLEIDLEKLERENIELRKQLKEHFDNPPLKLDEIELGMWVWDKKYNAYRLIADFEFEFESGRFYKRQVEE